MKKAEITQSVLCEPITAKQYELHFFESPEYPKNIRKVLPEHLAEIVEREARFNLYDKQCVVNTTTASQVFDCHTSMVTYMCRTGKIDCLQDLWLFYWIPIKALLKEYKKNHNS